MISVNRVTPDQIRINNNERALWAKLGLQWRQKSIILCPYYSADYVLFAQEVMSSLDNSVLVVVGEIKSHTISHWKKAFRNQNSTHTGIGLSSYDQKVRHIANISDIDLNCLIQMASLIVLPEGQGLNTLCENLITKSLLKAKVLISDISHCKKLEILSTSNSILIETGLWASWKSKIEDMLRYREDAEDFGFMAKCHTRNLLNQDMPESTLQSSALNRVGRWVTALNLDQIGYN